MLFKIFIKEWSWTKISNDSKKATKFILSSKNNTFTNPANALTSPKIKYKTVLDRDNNLGKLIISNLDEAELRSVPNGYQCLVSNEYGYSKLNITLQEGSC